MQKRIGRSSNILQNRTFIHGKYTKIVKTTNFPSVFIMFIIGQFACTDRKFKSIIEKFVDIEILFMKIHVVYMLVI